MQARVTVQVGDTKVTLEREHSGRQASKRRGVQVLLHEEGVAVAIEVVELTRVKSTTAARVVGRALGTNAQDAAKALPAPAVMLVEAAA